MTEGGPGQLVCRLEERAAQVPLSKRKEDTDRRLWGVQSQVVWPQQEITNPSYFTLETQRPAHDRGSVNVS